MNNWAGDGVENQENTKYAWLSLHFKGLRFLQNISASQHDETPVGNVENAFEVQ